MIKKLIKTFLSPEFLIFCVIGVLNTLIHLGVYNLSLMIPLAVEMVVILLANTIAFIVASCFSYWANATFTYKKKMSKQSFFLSMATFVTRLVLYNILLYFTVLIIKAFGWDFMIKLAPIPASTVLIPLQFLIFNKIFTQKLISTKTATPAIDSMVYEHKQ